MSNLIINLKGNNLKEKNKSHYNTDNYNGFMTKIDILT